MRQLDSISNSVISYLYVFLQIGCRVVAEPWVHSDLQTALNEACQCYWSHDFL